jgi:hypothetical protein
MASVPLMACVLMLLAACGGQGDTQSAAETFTSGAGFTLSTGPAEVTAGQGQEAVLQVTIERAAGFTGSVTVSLDSAPVGVTGDTLVFPDGASQGIMAISVGSDVVPGRKAALVVKAIGPDSTRASSSGLTVTLAEAYAQDKIAAALAAGTIDNETSLLYRAYAVWADSRLPDAYVGAGSLPEDNLLFAEIRRDFQRLSAAAQTQLRPFLVRPADASSVWNLGQKASAFAKSSRVQAPAAASASDCQGNQSGAWFSTHSATAEVRVWAICRGDPAMDLESHALVDKALATMSAIYGPMTGLMGKPLTDSEGGDGAIDIYIVDDGAYVNRRAENFRPGAGAITFADYAAQPGVSSKGTSAFVAIKRSLFYGSLWNAILIHEFFHVLQFAHNAEFSMREAPIASGSSAAVRQQHWFAESSAQWAEAYFERKVPGLSAPRVSYLDVHRLFKQYFLPSKEPLNAPGPNAHAYSAYIWSYFVEQETGNPDFMKHIWDGLDSVSTFEEADRVIDGVFPFDTHFKRFALRNLNTEFLPGDPLPKNKRYVDQDPDQFKDDRVTPPYEEGELKADQDYSHDFNLKNLSAAYLHLHVDLSGGAVSKVVFDAAALTPAAALDIQALVLTKDGWLAQPLTMTGDKITFCFDEGTTTASLYGNFEEVLLIVSNHSMQSGTNITGTLKVQPSSTPCKTGWEGTTESTMEIDTTFTGGTFHAVYATSAQMTLELDTMSPDLRNVYRLRAGSYTHQERSITTGLGACRGLGTASGPLHPELSSLDYTDGAVSGALYTYESPAEPLPQYIVEGFGARAFGTRVGDCGTPGRDRSEPIQAVLILWGFPPLPRGDITSNGATIEGSSQSTETGDHSVVVKNAKWTFRKKSL